MSNYDWLWNEYRRVAAKSAVRQGSEYRTLMAFHRGGQSGVLPSLVQPSLPWKAVYDDEVLVAVPSIPDVTGAGLAKRLKVLEARLELITQGKSVADDPYILILNQILDEAEQRRHTDRLDYLSWMEGEIETRIVRPGWECAGLHSRYQVQIGREVCRRLGYDPSIQSGRGLSFWFESIDKDVPVEYLICED